MLIMKKYQRNNSKMIHSEDILISVCELNVVMIVIIVRIRLLVDILSVLLSIVNCFRLFSNFELAQSSKLTRSIFDTEKNSKIRMTVGLILTS